MSSQEHASTVFSHTYTEGNGQVPPSDVFPGFTESFVLTVHGKGGHGASPHLTCDPVSAAVQIVLSIPGIQTRMIDPLEKIRFSFHSIHGGSAFNVIPDCVEIRGSIHCAHGSVFALVNARLNELITATASVYGCTAEIRLLTESTADHFRLSDE